MQKTSIKENMTMDVYVRFQHSWWRILLIICAIVAFILTCVFNGLASSGANGMNECHVSEKAYYCILSCSVSGIFNQRTGGVSDDNLTDFTPAGKFTRIWTETAIRKTFFSS